MAFAPQYALTKNESFKARVLVALVQTAVDVQGAGLASPPTAQENRRSTYAFNVLNNPDGHLSMMTLAVASDETISESSTDATIKGRVSAVWNALAGMIQPVATTVRSSNKNSSASGTAVSVAQGTGTTTGDVVLVVIACNNDRTITDTNGSTPFTNDLVDHHNANGGGMTISIWSRRIVGGDPTTFTFDISGLATRWSAITVTFQSPHASVIYDVSPTATDSANGTSTTAAAPNITTNNDKSIHCATCTLDRTTGFTAEPSGYTLEQTTDQEDTSFDDKVITPAGATGTGVSWTWTTGEWWVTTSFAIRDIGGAAAAVMPRKALLGVGL